MTAEDALPGARHRGSLGAPPAAASTACSAKRTVSGTDGVRSAGRRSAACLLKLSTKGPVLRDSHRRTATGTPASNGSAARSHVIAGRIRTLVATSAEGDATRDPPGCRRCRPLLLPVGLQRAVADDRGRGRRLHDRDARRAGGLRRRALERGARTRSRFTSTCSRGSRRWRRAIGSSACVRYSAACRGCESCPA